MGSKKIKKEIKPIEQWGAEEWELAYNQLNEKNTRLKEKMRKAMNAISQAQQHLSDAVV